MESLDRMERMENLDPRDYRDCLVPWEPLVTKVQWVNKDSKVTLVFPVRKDPEETLERMEYQATMDHQGLPDLQETEELQAALDPGDFKGCQDLLEKTVCRARMGMLVCKDLQG